MIWGERYLYHVQLLQSLFLSCFEHSFPVGHMHRVAVTHLQTTTTISRFCFTTTVSTVKNMFITHSLLTRLVGGDGDRHTLGGPCTAGLGDPIACVDDEGVVRVGPQLAHHHPGGPQASLARSEEDVGATGHTQLRARSRARADSWVIPVSRSALEYTSSWLDFSPHNPLV